MGWFQVIFAVVGLIRELLRYSSSRGDNGSVKRDHLNEIKTRIQQRRLSRRNKIK